MSGRTVIVTGGTSGIGKATAVALATMGAAVTIIGRDDRRTQDTARELRASGSGPVTALVADLSTQSEVRRVAQELLDRLPRIDVLVNNVGGFWSSRHVTADGLEHTLALNHLAPFLLTNLLIAHLVRYGPARIVTVSSNAHTAGRIDFDDLQGEQSYSGPRAYNQAKLANILFSYELARRLGGTEATANALHPGLVNTAFGAEDPSLLQRMLVPLIRPLMKSSAQGAATSVHLASAPSLDLVTGLYFVHGKPRRSSRRSYDVDTARRLWQVSAKMVGITDPTHIVPGTNVGESRASRSRTGDKTPPRGESHFA